MPRKCIIKTCENSTRKKEQGLIENVMFHRFPTNSIRRESWIINIQSLANQPGPIREGVLICSDHFDADSYVTKPDGKKILSDFAEPKVFRDVNQKLYESFSEVEMLLTNADSKNAKNLSFSDVEILSTNSDDHQERSEIDVGVDIVNLEQTYDNTTRCNDPDTNSLKLGRESGNRCCASQSSAVREGNNFIQSECRNEPRPQITRARPIRYPGDIIDIPNMSRRQLEHCVSLCEKKVETQAATIKALKRQVDTKNRQISSLRSLVKELKKKFALSENAAESIEVNKESLL